MPLRILFIMHRVPYPLTHGGSMAGNFVIEGLHKMGAQVSLISLNTSKHFVKKEEMPAWYEALHFKNFVPINNTITWHGAARQLFSKGSYNVSRFNSSALHESISHFLQQHEVDIIWLDNIYLHHCIPVIRQNSKAKIALRLLNIEFNIWEKLAANESNFLKKKYLTIQAKRLQHEEKNCWQQVDGMLCINQHEMPLVQQFATLVPIHYSPMGMPVSNENISLAKNCCFHLGSMDWLPNQEAVDWFIAQVVPLVLQKNPDFQFHFAGMHMPAKYFAQQNKNIHIHGAVPSATNFMQQHGICIAPLLSGAGVRIKILEAMSQGIPVVSTSIGAYGIDAKDNTAILIANEAEHFAQLLLSSSERLQAIGIQGKAYIQATYSSAAILNSTYQFLEQLSHA